ncbi:unnamed protein product [Vicia faba]|uniref:Cotton fiber protein n=1 Tax=Vicia faba TaxID=3906 RepID=A0AAV1A1P8_VICFA|nr:unnamed protein product [Vicia faba]
MSSPSHFNVSKSSSSSALASTKIKKHIHTLIVSSMCRMLRALSKVKSTLIHTLRDKKPNINFPYPSNKKHCNKRKKIIMGSFRLRYNWSSRSNSHVMPVPSRVYEGYLQWLEEGNDIDGDENKRNEKDEGIIKDVDRLAEMFIANCHEKFKVEMEESCRRYQEMLARSL